MNDGYIKLYRKIKNTSVWCDSDKLKLWIYCLTEAMHQDAIFLQENQKVELQKGQFITGRNRLEAEFNKGVSPKNRVSGSTLIRWLELFEKCGMLHIKKTNKYSIITILNWEKFQSNEQQLNNSCTSVEQQLNNSCTLYKNEKKIKNDKNIRKKENTKEKKIVSFSSILDDYTQNDELKKVLLSYVDMRNKMKGFTTHALELNLKTLDSLARVDETKIEIVNQTIEHSWKSFYKIKDKEFANQRSPKSKELPSWYHDQSNIQTNAEDFDELEMVKLQNKLRGVKS